MKILAFAASNSSTSINKKLITNVIKYYKSPDDEVELIDLNDFSMPLFSVDLEKQQGIPDTAYQLLEKIKWADMIIISFAEHNGNYAAVYKNSTDWVSRISGAIYRDKRLFLLATSDGKRGGSSVLEIAEKRMPFEKGEVLETFSLPFFYDNFEEGKGITNVLLRSQLESKIRKTKRLMQTALTSESN